MYNNYFVELLASFFEMKINKAVNIL